jgi:two-component system sensor histidine kinase BaeS
MKWPRFKLRAKILTTHLLVVATSTVALLVVILLVFSIFAPLPLGSDQMLWVLWFVVIIALAGVAAAVLSSRWLVEQVSVPLRHTSALADRLARGHYAERMPRAKEDRLPLDSKDELNNLALSLDDLAVALEAAEGRRTQLFGEIIHELRTPIAILEGYFEGLLDRHVKPTDETWSMLYDVAGRAHRLIDKLQALSRAESRQDPPDLQSVDPGLIAQAALDRMHLHLAEKGLDVVANIPAGLPLVLADADYTIQILVNLLTNALRYTPVPGTVTVAVSRLTDAAGDAGGGVAPGAREVIFGVTDTGIGIAAEHIPYLYERFFRVDRSSRQASGSSGIGLPLAKALVEAMGGRIWAESPGPGKGSSFYFTLLISADISTIPSPD